MKRYNHFWWFWSHVFVSNVIVERKFRTRTPFRNAQNKFSWEQVQLLILFWSRRVWFTEKNHTSLFSLSFSIRFLAGNAGSIPFTIKPYRVSEEAFRSCDTNGGQPIVDFSTREVIDVRQEFLRPGPNYFIGESDIVFTPRKTRKNTDDQQVCYFALRTESVKPFSDAGTWPPASLSSQISDSIRAQLRFIESRKCILLRSRKEQRVPNSLTHLLFDIQNLVSCLVLIDLFVDTQLRRMRLLWTAALVCESTSRWKITTARGRGSLECAGTRDAAWRIISW